MTVQTIRQQIGLHLKRSIARCPDVPVFQVKSLRAAAADAYARSTPDIAAAAAQLGHTPETMLRHYRQVRDGDRRAVADAAGLDVLPAGKVVQLRRGSST